MRSAERSNGQEDEFRPHPRYKVTTVLYDGTEGQEKVVTTIEEAREEVKKRLGVQRLSTKRKFVPDNHGIEAYKEDYPSRATQRPGHVVIDIVRSASQELLAVSGNHQTTVLPAAQIRELAEQSALPNPAQSALPSPTSQSALSSPSVTPLQHASSAASGARPRVHPTLGPSVAKNAVDTAAQEGTPTVPSLPAARPTSSNTPAILRTHLRVNASGRVREYVVYNPTTADNVIEDLRERRLEVEEWKERLTMIMVERTIAGVKYVDSEETWEKVV